MTGIVIEYNRRTRARRVAVFEGSTGPREALRLRLALEKKRKDSDLEIASLNSDSLATVEKTHSRYFMGEDLGALPKTLVS